MTANPGTKPRRKAPFLRAAVVGMLVVAGLLALRHPLVQENLQEEKLIALLEGFRSHPLAVPGLIIGFVVLACLGSPVTFLMMITGAVYGMFPGGFFALLSAVLSGILTFTVVKSLGDDVNFDRFGSKLGPMRKKIERQLNRHGFWNLVSFRFLPIPYAIANSLLALTGVRLSIFVLSTALALLPTSFAWTYFAQSLIGASEANRAIAIRNIAVGLVSLLALSLLPEIVRRIRRKRRYQELNEQRKGQCSRQDS